MSPLNVRYTTSGTSIYVATAVVTGSMVSITMARMFAGGSYAWLLALGGGVSAWIGAAVTAGQWWAAVQSRRGAAVLLRTVFTLAAIHLVFALCWLLLAWRSGTRVGELPIVAVISIVYAAPITLPIGLGVSWCLYLILRLNSPNHRINPSVDPVTVLANDARPAPGSPAGYPDR